MYRILVLAPDGIADSSLGLTLDAIYAANQVLESQRSRERLSATLFFPRRRRIRTKAGGRFAVFPNTKPSRFDALVVPGLGLTTPRGVEDFFAGRTGRSMVEWLRRSGPRFPLVAASCSAVFTLAEAELLDGRTATTTWWLGSEFRRRYPNVELDESRMTVESSDVITAGAALAQLDLMLHLIARAVSVDLARKVSRFLVIDQRPSQARYMALSFVAGLPPTITEIDRWIRSNIARPFSIGELAHSVGMSPRTLDRRIRKATGQGPSRLVQKIRAEQAAHFLQTSSLSLGEISEAVGYTDVSTLRRLLRRFVGCSPSELRRQSAAAGPECSGGI